MSTWITHEINARADGKVVATAVSEIKRLDDGRVWRCWKCGSLGSGLISEGAARGERDLHPCEPDDAAQPGPARWEDDEMSDQAKISPWEMATSSAYRWVANRQWELHCVDDDPNRYELVNRPTGAVRPLTSTDLYSALDEAGLILDPLEAAEE